jgi:hypothetical protein
MRCTGLHEKCIEVGQHEPARSEAKRCTGAQAAEKVADERVERKRRSAQHADRVYIRSDAE